MKRIFEFAKNVVFERSKPRFVNINITNQCNLKCIYCEIGQGLMQTDKPLLDLDDCLWIVDEMQKARVPTLMFCGGEPLLFHPLFDVLRHACECGIDTQIITNGMLLERLSTSERQTLKKCGTKVFVSIDSFDPAIQEKTRGARGALEKPVRGIQAMLSEGIEVGIVSVISPYNFNGLFEVVESADKLGVDSVSFQPIIHVSNYPEIAPIPSKKSLSILEENMGVVESEFQRIMSYEKTHRISTNAIALRQWLPSYTAYVSGGKDDRIFFERFLSRFFCAVLYDAMAIDYYGNILPCNIMGGGVNFKDKADRSLIDLWNESCAPIRQLHKKRDYPETCTSCVCLFDTNLLASIIKYPLSNFSVGLQVLTQSLGRRGKAKTNSG